MHGTVFWEQWGVCCGPTIAGGQWAACTHHGKMHLLIFERLLPRANLLSTTSQQTSEDSSLLVNEMVQFSSVDTIKKACCSAVRLQRTPIGCMISFLTISPSC
jgi:hypothetical protein